MWSRGILRRQIINNFKTSKTAVINSSRKTKNIQFYAHTLLAADMLCSNKTIFEPHKKIGFLPYAVLGRFSLHAALITLFRLAIL